MEEKNLVEELQVTYQGCLALFTDQDDHATSEDLKASIDQSLQKYLKMAHKLETYFLQQRLLLSVNKPEQLIKEDISDMKQELQRKDALIQKHQEQLQKWIKIINTPLGSGLGSTLGVSSVATAGTVPISSQPSTQQPATTSMQPSQQANQMGMSGGQMTVQNQQAPSSQMMSGPAGHAAHPQAAAAAHPPAHPAQPQGMQAPHMHPQPTSGGSAPPPPANQQPTNIYSQNPLAYLEKTTSNIGILEQQQARR